MKGDNEKDLALTHSSVRYMNVYERAHARERMEQAMALADWSIRAWDGIRAVLNRIGKAARRTMRQDRRRVIDATARRG